MRVAMVLGIGLGLGLAFVGCKNKLSGEVTIDGKPFALRACRSGEASGFSGVDLMDDAGLKLRLVAMVDGQALAFLFVSSAVADNLGACGPFILTTQNSTVNDIRNVKGEATLDCKSDGHRLKGRVMFENCH